MSWASWNAGYFGSALGLGCYWSGPDTPLPYLPEGAEARRPCLTAIKGAEKTGKQAPTLPAQYSSHHPACHL